MNLKEFIEKFVCHNTVIRLWTEYDGGHRMLWDKKSDKEVGMEWEITNGTGWQARYAACRVIGVTDILCAEFPEAVNIVIETGAP